MAGHTLITPTCESQDVIIPHETCKLLWVNGQTLDVSPNPVQSA